MAGLTQIERHLIDWVERKYAARVISRMNTEWEQKVDRPGGLPEGVNEYEYMRDRILEIHREMNSSKGDGIDGKEEATEV